MCQDLQYVFTLHIIMALLGRQANLTLFVKSGMVQTDCPPVFASHQSMSAHIHRAHLCDVQKVLRDWKHRCTGFLPTLKKSTQV